MRSWSSMCFRVLAFAAVAPLASSAQDWPGFQGPNRDGTSTERGLLRSFAKGGPKELWTVELSAGFGGAAVSGGEVYVLDRSPGESDVLRALDAGTGEELWRFEHEVEGRLSFPGSRCVPTVTQDFVYAVGGFGQVYCIDRHSHEAVWIVDLEQEYAGELPMFGFANSPLVIEDLVIVTPLGAEKGLLALDRFTGDEIWSTAGIGSSHSTPVLLELLGRPQIVFLSSQIQMPDNAGPPGGRPPATPPRTLPNSTPPVAPPQEFPDTTVPEDMANFTMPGKGILSAYSTEGELLWSSDRFYCSTAIPAPIRIDDEHLFLTGGYQSGSMLVKLVEGKKGIELKEVFRIEKGAQVHIPVFFEDHLYILVNENSNDPRPRRKFGGLACLDLQGHELWRTGEEPFFGRGDLLLADGMLVIQDGLSGTLRLVEPTPEGYRPLAEANVFGVEDRRDHQMWAPMALSNGRLFMRSQDELKCLDLRDPAGE